MRFGSRWSIWPLSFALTLVGCKPKHEAPTAGAPSASASVARLPPPKRHDWPAPSGPVLAVLAGQGVGPIRVGATPATIERLMEAPCEIKSAEFCKYPSRGVEFTLENGATKTVHIYRAGRPAGKDKAGNDAEYGFFRGAIPPDLQLGMIPAAIQEHLGPPTRIERREQAGAAENVETHYYPGLTARYDRLENGNLVLAEIIVFKEAPSPAPSASGGKR
jgi:hypothetical protein